MSHLDEYAFYTATGKRTFVDADDFLFTGTWSTSGTYLASPLMAAMYGASKYMAVTDNIGRNPTIQPTEFEPTIYWSPLVLISEGTTAQSDLEPIGQEALELAQSAYAIAVQGTNTGSAAYALADLAFNLASNGTALAQAAYNLAAIGTNVGTAAYNFAGSAFTLAGDAYNVAQSAFDIAVIGTNAAQDANDLAYLALLTAWNGTALAQVGTTTADTALAIAVAGTDLAYTALSTAWNGTAGVSQVLAVAVSGSNTANSALSGADAAYALAVTGTNAASNKVDRSGDTMSGTLTTPNLFYVGTNADSAAGTLSVNLLGVGFLTHRVDSDVHVITEGEETAFNGTFIPSSSVRFVHDSADRSITFHSQIRFLSTAPTTLTANKISVLSLTAFGTTPADVIGAYSAEA